MKISKCEIAEIESDQFKSKLSLKALKRSYCNTKNNYVKRS